MTDTREIEFFFDYISPYAYLAWEESKRIAERHNALIVPKPILFAALLNHNNTRGPAEIESKRRYLFVDILRKAASLDVEIDVPATHPFNPLVALRATCAADEASRNEVVSKIYASVWREGGDASADSLKERGLGDLVEGASNDSVKSLLRTYTDEALRDGIFGVPTLRYGGELFWGVDSLPFLEARLRGEPGPPVEKVERWKTLKASASRK